MLLTLLTIAFDLVVEQLTVLFRDEFCDWYIEIAKERLAGPQAEQAGTRRTLARVFAAILRLAHPLVPFITAELWRHISPLAGITSVDIIKAPYPVCNAEFINAKAEEQMEDFQKLVLTCRSLRHSLGVDPSLRLPATLEQRQEHIVASVGLLKAFSALG